MSLPTGSQTPVWERLRAKLRFGPDRVEERNGVSPEPFPNRSLGTRMILWLLQAASCALLKPKDPSAFRRAGGRQLLPAGETGVEFVPVGDRGLAQPPAQVDLVVVEDAREIHESGVGIFQLHAQVPELLEVLLHALAAALELGLDLVEFLLIGVARLVAARRHRHAAEP